MQSNLIRLCGLAAMLGGALLVLGAVITASMPRGCIADECAVRPMRDTSGLAPISILSALLAAAGMVVLVRHPGRFGRLGRASLIFIAIGAAMLLIVGALAMLGFNDQNWQALMTIPFGIA